MWEGKDMEGDAMSIHVCMGRWCRDVEMSDYKWHRPSSWVSAYAQKNNVGCKSEKRGWEKGGHENLLHLHGKVMQICEMHNPMDYHLKVRPCESNKLKLFH